jgi:diguanylate cyclase (GGDEF)-like protein
MTHAAEARCETPGGRPAEIFVLLEALRVLVGASIVSLASTDRDSGVISASEGVDGEYPSPRVPGFAERLTAWLSNGGDDGAQASWNSESTQWDSVIFETRTVNGERTGALGIARPAAKASEPWSTRELATIKTFASLCESQRDTNSWDPPAPAQGPLDALVTQIAVRLMEVSANELTASLDWTLQLLVEFFDVDTSFLRRTDIERDITVLVAEWPKRHDIPDPDPLGEVPFGADPVFDAIRDLKEPFVMRPTKSSDAYQERVEQGSGVHQVSMAMVPLVQRSATIGVLGFVKFGDRPWDTAETNALQAVASLLAQLQARIAAEERLVYQAYHDELTGLPNRRALLEDLNRRLSELGAGRTTALLFIDLDRFKAINDFLGHGAGDRLLQTVAERLRGAVRAEDFVARLAGDEFVLLLEGATVEVDALAVADKLLELVAQPVEMSGHQVSRTASLGISFGSSESTTSDDVLAHADAALHRAKAQGGNQTVVFDAALRALVEKQSDTEMLLRHAIDHEGLILHYQPEVDLRTGQLLAVEALVRWNHPDRGMLTASSFIKVAEDTGLVVDLGRWVLAEACRQMAAWRQAHPQLHFTMRVNMSPAQLSTRHVVQMVKDCLERNHLPGRLLCLEITEHAVMQDVEKATRVLLELKALGISLAIDDFGTGYSSMSQLKRLPVDVLKIDQTFVAGLGIDRGDRAIVDATVRLARSFGLEVVAEGVETPELVQQLLNLDCYRAQGFLLCRPKPASDLVAMFLQGGLDPTTFSDPEAQPPSSLARARTRAPRLLPLDVNDDPAEMVAFRPANSTS